MNQIRCLVRGISVALSPEEKVRQKLLAWLHKTRGIPLPQMAVEASLRPWGGDADRVDLLVLRPQAQGGLGPWLLAECKAPGQMHPQKWLDQVSRYLRTAQPKYLLGTDGKELWLYALQGDTYQLTTTLPHWDHTP